MRPAALLAAGALLFLFILQVSIAGALRGPVPRVVLSWAPADADARANVAARILAMDRSPSARARAEALAQDALARDVTRVAALRSLAMSRIEPGRPAIEAERLMNLAQRLSRRDRATQLWLADRAARRRDPGALIRHFDFALRTTSDGRPTLLTALAAATRDPLIATAVGEALTEKPNWWLHFIAVVIDTGSPDQILQFVRGRLNPAIEAERAVMRSAVERLVGLGSFEGAWQIYSEAVGRENPERLREAVRNGGFEQAPYFAPFEWTLSVSAERQGSREARPDGEGAVLRLAADTTVVGDAAAQLVRLAPGAYQVRFEAGAIPDNPERRPRLVVRCAASGAILSSARPQAAGAGPFALQASLQVPAGCPWQWLAVQVSGSASEIDPGPWIDNVAITR